MISSLTFKHFVSHISPPTPLLNSLSASSYVCVLWVMLWYTAVGSSSVKSPWSWNAPTSTFKLDSISSAGSDKRVCVQRSQVRGFEWGWGWELNEKSLLRFSLCCDFSAPVYCWTLKQCFSKCGWGCIFGFKEMVLVGRTWCGAQFVALSCKCFTTEMYCIYPVFSFSKITNNGILFSLQILREILAVNMISTTHQSPLYKKGFLTFVHWWEHWLFWEFIRLFCGHWLLTHASKAPVLCHIDFRFKKCFIMCFLCVFHWIKAWFYS